MGADSYADLLERLFAEFEDRHTLVIVEEVANTCRSELSGQTPSGAQFELLHRLACQRLAALPATRAQARQD